MPSLTTHKLFAEQVLNNINYKNINKDIYYMFSQSHDILFYYKGKNHKYYNKLGRTCHHKNTKDYIINIINYIKDNNLENNLEILSYLFGVITHYYLDSTIHPYVFYKTGRDKNTKETKKYRGKHTLFERQLDKTMYNKFTNLSYNKCNITQNIIPKTNLTKELKLLIDYAYNQTYNEPNISNIIEQSYKQMRTLHKLFVMDKLGIKYYLYKLIDIITLNKTKHLCSYSTYINSNINISNNNTWYHPTTNEKHNESILDLFNKANIDCTNTINIILDYLNDRNNKPPIIKDIDYSTGLLLKENQKMRYFEY